MANGISLEGLGAARAFMAKNKKRMAIDLERYLRTVSSRLVSNSRSFLKKDGDGSHDGYESGQLRTSINFVTDGDPAQVMRSTIGPIGNDRASVTELGWLIALLIENGYQIREKHFVPFGKYPLFDRWADRNGFNTRLGGLMVKPRTYEGLHYMQKGYEETIPFARMRWDEMISKWRLMLVKETLG